MKNKISWSLKPDKKNVYPRTNKLSGSNKTLPNIILFIYAGFLGLPLSILFCFPANANSQVQRQEKPDFRRKKQENVSYDDFVGSQACAECHEREYSVWKQSTHGRAGGKPNKETVISLFDGTKLKFNDALVKLSVNNKKEYLFIVVQQGIPNKVFKVEAVIGGGHIEGGGTQTYFTRFPDGTLRLLPFDFIRKENLWFCQVRNNRGWIPISENLSINDCSNWPPYRILGSNHNFDNYCQECHGSQIQTSYDKQMKKYVTKYKSLAINCESCHGPGKRHIKLAKSGNIHKLKNIGMEALSLLDKESSIIICLQCHAFRQALTDSNYLKGNDFEEYYSTKLHAWDFQEFHADGRTQSFAYQKNHLYSDCYINGSMTCVDCHDPHSQRYRDINGSELNNKFDNKQCLDCHPGKKNNPSRHTHHNPDSPGNLCTSCHMPFFQHKAFGDILRFARSDHTISIPRPEFDSKLGVENACLQCHRDKTISWLQRKTEEWYGEIKPHKNIIKSLINIHEINDRKKAAHLLLNNEEKHAIAQISALTFFIKKFLFPEMPYLEPEIIKKLKQLGSSRDKDLKALALATLHLTKDRDPTIHSYLLTKLRESKGNNISLKYRWIFALLMMGRNFKQRGDYEKAAVVYKKALDIEPDNGETHFNLGIVMTKLRKINEAYNHYLKALEKKPDHANSHRNIAIILLAMGKNDEGVKHFIKALILRPDDVELRNDFGMILANIGKNEEAINQFKKILTIRPKFVSAIFNLGVTLLNQGKEEEGVRYFHETIKFDPNHQEAKSLLNIPD